MLIVGLTGGIGSGKSTVSQIFESLSVPVIDMDIIAREITQPGSDALKQICDHFGKDILDQGGALNRKQLRQLVFKSSDNRLRLESILHPEIRKEALRQLARLDNREIPYSIVVIPLLAESTSLFPVDRVLVIDATEALQLQRTCRRDNISEQAARDIMASQVSRNQRLKIADDIIENNGDIDLLKEKVVNLHHKYRDLARKK